MCFIKLHIMELHCKGETNKYFLQRTHYLTCRKISRCDLYTKTSHNEDNYVFTMGHQAYLTNLQNCIKRHPLAILGIVS